MCTLYVKYPTSFHSSDSFRLLCSLVVYQLINTKLPVGFFLWGTSSSMVNP